MALAKCRECGGRVSTEAVSCPHCGANTPALIPNSPTKGLHPNAGMSRTKKVLLVLFAVYFVGVASQLVVKGTTSNTAGAAPQTTGGPQTQGAPSPRVECYDKGYAIATAYLANIKQAIDVGALASEMMEHGCRSTATASSATACFEDCKAGFKFKAKQWVKND